MNTVDALTTTSHCTVLEPRVRMPCLLRSIRSHSIHGARVFTAKSATPTKAIYQLNEALRTRVASVLVTIPIDDLYETERTLFKPVGNASGHAVITKETIFYAQGGGQPFDTGYMIVPESPDVESVRVGAGGRTLHFGMFEDEASFMTGDMVEQQIGGQRRDANSKCHAAGRTVGLAVRRLAEREADVYATELKASHYPDANFVESKGLIDGKRKDAIQSQSTKYVKQALPIKLCWYNLEELGEKGVITTDGMPIVAGPDDNVRVVDIVGADAYPCGGTHVQGTSLVGNIVVKDIETSRGIGRVSYTVHEKYEIFLSDGRNHGTERSADSLTLNLLQSRFRWCSGG